MREGVQWVLYHNVHTQQTQLANHNTPDFSVRVVLRLFLHCLHLSQFIHLWLNIDLTNRINMCVLVRLCYLASP